jgi:hypothetical protein
VLLYKKNKKIKKISKRHRTAHDRTRRRTAHERKREGTPARTASSKGVAPHLSLTSTLAPLFTKYSATLSRPSAAAK